MNRRGFCKSLAAVPVVAAIGLGATRDGVLIHAGNYHNNPLAYAKACRWPKLRPRHLATLHWDSVTHDGVNMGTLQFAKSTVWQVRSK